MSTIPEPSNVLSAFDLLLEEVEAEIDHVNRLGVRAAVARAETLVGLFRAQV